MPVGIEVAPCGRSRVGEIRDAEVGRDVGKPAAVIAIEPVGDAVLETNE